MARGPAMAQPPSDPPFDAATSVDAMLDTGSLPADYSIVVLPVHAEAGQADADLVTPLARCELHPHLESWRGGPQTGASCGDIIYSSDAHDLDRLRCLFPASESSRRRQR